MCLILRQEIEVVTKTPAGNGAFLCDGLTDPIVLAVNGGADGEARPSWGTFRLALVEAVQINLTTA